jgi:RNA polymerase sigma-70 factor (ECF subfamily)
MAVWRDRQRRREWALPAETLERLAGQAETGALEATEVKHELLRQCLQQLRPEDRGLILRRYTGSSGLRELAAELGRTAESLKVSLHRIRVALRTCIRRRMRTREVLS